MMIYAIASGGRLDVARGELQALMLSVGQRVEPVEREGVIFCDARFVPEGLGGRAAFIKELGVLIAEVSACRLGDVELDGAARLLEGKSFKVDSEGFHGNTKGEVDACLGERIVRSIPGAEVDVKEPQLVVRALNTGGRVLLGVMEPTVKRKWWERRPRSRAFFHPSALHPKMARLMVNLSALAPSEVLLDPFAGTCSVVMEACLVGGLGIAIDLDPRMVTGGKRNLEELGMSSKSEVLHGDVRHLPIREVDAIATDIPYGRVSSSWGASTWDLLRGLLDSAVGCLGRGHRLVVMHPREVSPKDAKGFERVGEYEFRAHRSLTRVITVLERET